MERIGMQWQVRRGRFAHLSGFCDWYCWYVHSLFCQYRELLFLVLLRTHSSYRGLGQRQGLMDCLA